MAAPFPGGILPSDNPEAANQAAVRQLLSELIDMQFLDLRVLLRLPDPALAPNVGCNFTAAAMMTNLISGPARCMSRPQRRSLITSTTRA